MSCSATMNKLNVLLATNLINNGMVEEFRAIMICKFMEETIILIITLYLIYIKFTHDK